MFRFIKLLWRFRKVILGVLAAAETLRNDPEISKPNIKKVDGPQELSKADWKQALKLTKAALKDKELGFAAAGLAYYATLTFFPAVLGLAGIYVLFTSPQQLLQAINGLHFVLPTAIYSLLHQALVPIGQNHHSHALLAVILSIVALLWTTSGGLQSLVKATNRAYEVEETRGFVKLRLTSIALSLVLLVFGGIMVFLLILQGSALHHWGWPGFAASFFPILRWPLLVILISLVLATIYRYAPNRKEPRWQWVSWGAVAASLIWLLASALFFIYAQNFANFNKTYGTFAGIIVQMSWFNLSSLIVLLGAQVNKKLEVVAPTRVIH